VIAPIRMLDLNSTLALTPSVKWCLIEEEWENKFWWIFGRVTLMGTSRGCGIHHSHQRFFGWWNFARKRN
jgi:hypothetical protein